MAIATEQHALEQVKLRNDFYKDGFRKVILALLGSVLLNIILVVALLMHGQKEPEKFFFATTGDGQLIPLYPTVMPVVTTATVINWASMNVPNIYSLDFIHYRAQLNTVQQYFTPGGWTQFQAAFASQLNEILTNKWIVSAASNGVPVVTGEGVFNGVYMWQLQMPLTISFQQGATATTRNVLLTLVIARVNNVAAHQILGIDQIIQQVQ